MDNFTEKRLLKNDDSKLAKPKDILELALHDINNGRIKPTGMILIFADEKENTRSVYRAGLNWQEQIAFLHLELSDIVAYKINLKP